VSYSIDINYYRRLTMTVTEIGILNLTNPFDLPLTNIKIPCGTGFPSPADDYVEERLDLNKLLIEHPAATFYARVEGDSMIEAGIYHDDILIIDKAKEAKHQNVIVAWINGEFTAKTYYIDQRLGKVFLVPRNDKYLPQEITPEMDFMIWGVVTYNIHKL
jgi:DNA polymerase V